MGLHFSVDLQAEGAARVKSPGPFRLLVLGDFSGCGDQNTPADPPPTLGRPLRVDRDNLEALLSRLKPSLRCQPQPDSPPADICFATLDDFLPDRLAARVAPLATLLELRRRLHNPATFAAAAEVVQSWGPAVGRSAQAPSAPTSPAGAGERAAGGQPGAEHAGLASGVSGTPAPAERGTGAAAGDAATSPPRGGHGAPGESLLDALISSTEAQFSGSQGPKAAPTAPAAGSMVERAVRQMVQQAVAGQQVAAPPKELPELANRLDARISLLLRNIMHAPQFRRLEALWRGLDWLLRRLDDETCQALVLDVTPQQLAADLKSAADLSATQLGRLLLDEAQDHPWWLAIACFEFAPTRDDLELLGRLAILGQQARTPMVAAASRALVGCTDAAAAAEPQQWASIATGDLADAWRLLRSLPAARYAALAFPGFAVREPYQQHPLGAGAAFSELDAPGAEALLWANPAFAFAAVAADAFRSSGPRFVLNSARLEGLPLAVSNRGGQREQLPCAEFWLAERATRTLQELGLVPLVPIRHSDAIALPTLHSLATPDAPLAGRWLG
jgi:type VI secretion system ImpC/EvpB family protein/type VI secretion system ImpB/VipA family protein